MKIGIITLFGAYNYGNRLQNLAVTELLKRQGHVVQTIVCEKFRLRGFIKNIYCKILFWRPIAKRNRAFEKFNDKYIKVHHLYRKDSLIPTSVGEMYDAFIVGSDQVWNPEIRRKEKQNFFLKFAPAKKRLCISPSLGGAKVAEKYEGEFKNGLEGFRYLSCREMQGAAEIKRMTGKDCETLIDPTLALEAHFWRGIADYGDVPQEKYVCCIFLGTIDRGVKASIDAYAGKNNCKIINLLSTDSPFFSKGPEYFISLIDRAEMVFTDSFHAVAFSINLNTPFYAFERIHRNNLSSTNSRILTVTELFGVEDRFVRSNTYEYVSEMNFSKANANLAICRDKLNTFLMKSIQAVEE